MNSVFWERRARVAGEARSRTRRADGGRPGRKCLKAWFWQSIETITSGTMPDPDERGQRRVGGKERRLARRIAQHLERCVQRGTRRRDSRLRYPFRPHLKPLCRFKVCQDVGHPPLAKMGLHSVVGLRRLDGGPYQDADALKEVGFRIAPSTKRY